MNEYDRCPTEEDLGLLTLLIKSGGLAQSRLDGALVAVGLTFAKWRALDALEKAKSPMSLGTLANRLNCVKSNVTQLADKLEAEGIISRADDPDDRRSIVVKLTQPGHELHRQGLRAMEATTRALFTSSSKKDRAALRRLLGQLERGEFLKMS